MKKSQTLRLLATIAATAALPVAVHASGFTDPSAGQMTLWINTATGDVELVGNNTTIVGYQISSPSQSILYTNWTKPITHVPTTGWGPATPSGGYIAEVTSNSSYAVTTQDTHPYDLGDIFNPAAVHDLALHFTSFVGGSASYVLGNVQYGVPTLTWDPGHSPTTPGSDGAGNWDTTSTIWSNGSTDQAWTNGFVASIGANGTGNTITIDAAGITATGITFNPLTSGQYTIASAASGDNLTLSGDITLNANATISAPIVGTGAITIVGPDTLTLSGANTFTGGITLDSGILSVSSEGNLGGAANPVTFNGGELLSTALFLTDSRAITLDAASGTTIDIHGGQDSFSGAISGAGALTILDSAPITTSSITLAGANTYTGGTVLNSTHMIITADNNLGASTGTITLNNSQLETRGVVNTGRNIILDGSGDILNSYNESETFSGVISGTAPLTVTNFGGGVLAFSGTNTYTGGTIIQDGVLAVSTDANLGASSGAITLQGGTLKTLASLTTARSVVLASGGSSGGYIDTDGAHTDTFSGVISGPTSLDIEDSTLGSSGKVVFSGANTYIGLTKISQGTLALSGTGTIADSSYLQIITGAVFDISATTGGATVKSFGGYGNINLGAQPLTENIASVSVADFDGVMSGTGSFTLSGTGGIQFFKGINTYTGATIINDGTLALSHGGSIAASSGVTFNLSTSVLDISQAASGETVKALSGSLGTVALGSQTLTINGTGSSVFDGVIQTSGPVFGNGTGGGLTVTAGTQTLGGVNIYTGATTITGGTLALSGPGSIADSSGVVLSSGGTFDISGTTSGATILGLTGTGGTVNLGGQTLSLSLPTSQADTFNGIIEGVGGGLTLSGTSATEILGGTNTYSGTTTINSGTLEFTGSTAGLTGGIVNNSALVFHQTASSSLSSAISGTGGVTENGSAGTALTLTGANTYSGPTTITSGALDIGTGGSLAHSNITIASGASLGGTGTITWNLTNNSGDLINNSGALNITGLNLILNITGTQTQSQYILADDTSGTLTGTRFATVAGLGSGIIDYTGTTLHPNDIVLVVPLTLSWDGATVKTGALSDGSGNWDTTNTNNTWALASADQAWSNGSSASIGAGGGTSETITIDAGPIVVSNLSFNAMTSGAQYTIAGTGANTLEVDGTISLANNATISAGLVGALPLTITGAHTLTLTGTNTYTGGTTLENGVTVNFNNASAFGTGAITVGTGGATLQYNAASLTIANNLAIAGGAILDANGLGDPTSGVTFAGNITGAGGLTVTSSVAGGELYLTGNNSAFTGNTTLLNGVETGFNTSTSFGSGTVTIGTGGGTLEYTANLTVSNRLILAASGGINAHGTTSTWAGVVSGTGGLLVHDSLGSGILTLSAINTYSGGTTIGLGNTVTLALSGAGSISSSSYVATVAGATFDVSQVSAGTVNITGLQGDGGTVALGSKTLDITGSGTYTFSGVIQNGGLGGGTGAGLTLSGTGLLTLTGANTYTGVTAINSGELLLSTGGSIADSSNVSLTSGAKFDISQTTSGATVNGLTGSGGYVYTGAETLTVNVAGTDSFGGQISDSGGVINVQGGGLTKTGSGTLTLTGQFDNYSGATTISAGTLAVSAAAGDFDSSSNIAIASGATLDISAVSGETAHSITGFGIVALGSTSLELFAASGSYTFGGLIKDGGISGGNGGSLIIGIPGSAGTTILTGANTYTGSTTIASGTLGLSVTGSIADSSSVILDTGGTANSTFDISTLTNGGASIKSLASTSVGAGSGTASVLLGTNSLTIANGSGNFAGVISGTGGLTINGGTQTLSGVNTYTDITSVNGGILALSGAGSVADSSRIALSPGGTFDISATTSGTTVLGLAGIGGTVNLGSKTLSVTLPTSQADTFNGIIEGVGGGLTLSGTRATEILGGTNTYSGTTTINSGTLEFTGSTAGLTGGIVNNSALVFQQTASSSLSSAISGTGGVTENGSAGTALTLTGANTYSGPTTITSGALDIGTGGSLANSNITIDSGASLGGTGTITWNLTNNSGDLINNSGTLNITGLNLILNITGTQTQSQYILADDTSGTLTGTRFATVAGLGSGIIDYTGTTLHPNDIVLVVPLTLSWDGATVKTGALSDGSGNWDTTNTNNTWALAGADQAWSNGSSASIGAGGATNETVTIDAGPIVVSNLSFNAMTSGAQYTIAGTGTNTLEVDGTISLANNATISASLVGSNPLTVTGAHTLALTGVNTYTGGTTLENGVIVNFNNASAFSTGAIAVGTGGATLQYGAASLTLGNALEIYGNATLDVNNLTGEIYSGAITYTSGFMARLMVINGNLQLTGTNSSTFTAGNLIVGNGTAAAVGFTNAANLPGAGAGIELNAGTLVYSGASAVTISNTITNTGASVLDGINAGSQTVTLSGALANSSAGATMQLDNGTFVLASNQGSQFSAGTLELGNNTPTTIAEFSSAANLPGAAASISLNDAELKYTGSTAATIASGLNITGTNPDIIDAGGAGGVLTLAGNLADTTGTLTLQNGAFILAGTGTSANFTGGSLQIGNGGSVNTNVGFSTLANLPATAVTITLNNGTLTDLAASGAGLNISNPIALSGAGSFVDAGSGTQAQPTILSSAITGSSGFTVGGASDSDYIAVSNANTGYSGNFTINGGAVIQENAAAFGTGNLIVSGGELVSNTVATNGTAATAMQVAGNYTQTSGGGLALAIVSPTSADTLNVTGTATLGGTLLLDVNAAAVPAIAQRVNYTLITAGTSLTGNFTNYAFAPGSATAVSFSGVDVGNTYVLTLLGGFNFALSAQNSNQLALANYIDTAANNPGINPALQSLLLTLSGQSPQDIANALSQMSPSVYGGLANMQITNSVFNSEAINSQISSGFNGGGFNTAGLTLLKTTNTDPFSLALASALQSNATVNAATTSTQYIDDVMHANSGNVPLPSRESAADSFGGFIAGQAILGSQPTDSSGENYFTGGLNTGLDYRFAKSLVVGLSFNYSYTGAHLDAQGSTLRDNSYAPGLFAGYRRGNFFADASTDYTYNQYTVHRNSTVGGTTSTATGKPDSNQFDLNTMIGFNFPIFRHFKTGPALGLDYTHISMSSFSETGSPTDLSVSSQSIDSLRSLLGGQAQYKLRLPKVPMPLVISANAFWQHEYLDNSRGISSSLTGLGGGTFITNVPNAGRDSALLGAGVSGKICPNATLFANYEAQIGPNNQHSQSVMVGMAVSF